MKIVVSLQAIDAHSIVVGLGNFDGLHLGHQSVLKTVLSKAQDHQSAAVCVTFKPHPRQVLKPEQEPFLITSFDQKVAVLESLGFPYVCAIPFDATFSQLSHDAFVHNVLLSGPKVAAVVVGFNFQFGQRRQGTTKYLTQALMAKGIEVIVIDAFEINGQVVSSSHIRSVIQSGRIDQAAQYLGRPVNISGIVVQGSARGRRMGYPTANLDVSQEVLPPLGVYSVQVHYKQNIYNGVMNIGRRPTFDEDSHNIFEVHIFDFNEPIYNQLIDVDIVCKLRDEKKFASQEDLMIQIEKDCQLARELIGSIDGKCHV